MGLRSTDGLAVAMAMAFALEDAEKCYVRQEKVEETAGIYSKTINEGQQ